MLKLFQKKMRRAWSQHHPCCATCRLPPPPDTRNPAPQAPLVHHDISYGRWHSAADTAVRKSMPVTVSRCCVAYRSLHRPIPAGPAPQAHCTVAQLPTHCPGCITITLPHASRPAAPQTRDSHHRQREFRSLCAQKCARLAVAVPRRGAGTGARLNCGSLGSSCYWRLGRVGSCWVRGCFRGRRGRCRWTGWCWLASNWLGTWA
jgi:hypothetical protein